MVNWDGDQYRDVDPLRKMIAELSLGEVVLAGNERVLDVGCGDGVLTLQLAEQLRSGSFVGVDISENSIEDATARASGGEFNGRFQLANALDLPFEHDFDVAVAFNVLEWIEDKGTALAQIANSLDPGGRAYVQMAISSERPNLEAITVDVARRWRYRETFYDFATPYQQIKADSFFDLAAGAGLTVSNLAVKDFEWQFDSDQAFRKWFLRSASMWIELLKESMVDDFVDEVLARYRLVTGANGLLRISQLGASLTLADR